MNKFTKFLAGASLALVLGAGGVLTYAGATGMFKPDSNVSESQDQQENQKDKQIEELTQQLESFKGLLKQKEDELAQEKENGDIVQQQLETKGQQLQEMQQELAQANGDKANLTERVNSLTSEIEELNQSLSDSNSRQQELEDEVQKVSETIAELNQKLLQCLSEIKADVSELGLTQYDHILKSKFGLFISYQKTESEGLWFYDLLSGDLKQVYATGCRYTSIEDFEDGSVLLDEWNKSAIYFDYSTKECKFLINKYGSSSDFRSLVRVENGCYIGQKFDCYIDMTTKTAKKLDATYRKLAAFGNGVFALSGDYYQKFCFIDNNQSVTELSEEQVVMTRDPSTVYFGDYVLISSYQSGSYKNYCFNHITKTFTKFDDTSIDPAAFADKGVYEVNGGYLLNQGQFLFNTQETSLTYLNCPAMTIKQKLDLGDNLFLIVCNISFNDFSWDTGNTVAYYDGNDHTMHKLDLHFSDGESSINLIPSERGAAISEQVYGRDIYEFNKTDKSVKSIVPYSSGYIFEAVHTFANGVLAVTHKDIMFYDYATENYETIEIPNKSSDCWFDTIIPCQDGCLIVSKFRNSQILYFKNAEKTLTDEYNNKKTTVRDYLSVDGKVFLLDDGVAALKYFDVNSKEAQRINTILDFKSSSANATLSLTEEGIEVTYDEVVYLVDKDTYKYKIKEVIVKL